MGDSNASNNKLKDPKDVKQFISEIENRPEIWNFKLTDYHKKRQKKLEEVAALFDVPTKIVQRKWENLRDYFNSLKKDYKKNLPRSGAGTIAAIPEPKWQYWTDMKFMLTIDEPTVDVVSSLDGTTNDRAELSEQEGPPNAPPFRASSTSRAAAPDCLAVADTPPTSQQAGESNESTPQSTPRNRNPSQQKRKRKGDDGVDDVMAAISSASNVLDQILVSHLPTSERRPGPVSEVFFKSLAAQFDMVHKDKQPALMLELQKILTNAIMPIPAMTSTQTALSQPAYQQQSYQQQPNTSTPQYSYGPNSDYELSQIY